MDGPEGGSRRECRRGGLLGISNFFSVLAQVSSLSFCSSLQEHKHMVTDMRFFNASSNVLARCDQSGEVIITKVNRMISPWLAGSQLMMQ